MRGERAQWQPHPGPQPPPAAAFFAPPEVDPPSSDFLLELSEDDELDDDDEEEDDEPDLPPYPSEYQPPPLSWNAVREISFSRLPEHSVHFVSGGSLNFWITSRVWPQEAQRYS